MRAKATIIDVRIDEIDASRVDRLKRDFPSSRSQLSLRAPA
jgi:hypothetical protein